jgi:glycerol-3-phosphate dehydrogenase
MNARPELAQPLHTRLPITAAQVVWAVTQEMARTVDDVLARRTRALVLDARAALDMAPAVARIMAQELKRDQKWQAEQLAQFTALAAGYLVQPSPPRMPASRSV